MHFTGVNGTVESKNPSLKDTLIITALLVYTFNLFLSYFLSFFGLVPLSVSLFNYCNCPPPNEANVLNQPTSQDTSYNN